MKEVTFGSIMNKSVEPEEQVIEVPARTLTEKIMITIEYLAGATLGMFCLWIYNTGLCIKGALDIMVELYWIWRE